MLFKENDPPKKIWELDEKLLEQSPFTYEVYAGTLRAKNKKELLLEGDKASWSPDSLQQLDLTTFPLVDDFCIELHSVFHSRSSLADPSTENTLIDFTSAQHGILVRTAFLDLMASSETSIAIGPQDNPYMDCDQGYLLVVFVHENFVYILSGNDDANLNLYTTWFKVPAETYAEAWIDIKKWYQWKMNNKPRFL